MSEATPAHQRMYEQLQQGDEAFIAAARQEWNTAGRAVQRIRDSIVAKLDAIQPDWQSPAAESYYAVMGDFAQRFSEAAEAAYRADMVLRDAENGLVEAKRMMPTPGDSAWRVGPFDQTAEEEQQAREAMRHVSGKYRAVARDLPTAPPVDGPLMGGGIAAGDLWPPDEHEGEAQQPPPGGPGPGSGGPVSPASGGPQVPGRGGGPSGLEFDQSGGTELAGGATPGAVGGLRGGTLPGGPSGPLPGGPGSSGGPGAGPAAPGAPGAGGGRGGRGGIGRPGAGGGGRVPGGGALPGLGAGSTGGAPGGGSGRGPAGRGGTLGGPGGRGGTGSGPAGGAGGAGRGGGVGRAGMMPMGGAGAGGQGDSQDKQRRGWLREQEDVWGTKDLHAAPGVLGQPSKRQDDDEDDEDW